MRGVCQAAQAAYTARATEHPGRHPPSWSPAFHTFCPNSFLGDSPGTGPLEASAWLPQTAPPHPPLGRALSTVADSPRSTRC